MKEKNVSLVSSTATSIQGDIGVIKYFYISSKVTDLSTTTEVDFI
jgi:hypothetical protein